MPDLAELQTLMAEALLAGRYGALQTQVLAGLADEAFGLHRNTALHGLVNALRLSYPTVDALVGEAFFDQAALDFVEAHAPSSPWLAGYGSAFADFLSSYAFAADLAYLADVARLDAAIEAAACQAVGADGLQFDLGQALLTLDASLRVIELDYPAAAVRDAVEQDEEALAAIDMTPRRHALALWRIPAGAAVRPLSPISAAFLKALLHGGDLETAPTNRDNAATLQSEVFSAPFARLALMERDRP